MGTRREGGRVNADPSVVALYVGLAAAPLLLVACTAFTKVAVVLASVRVGLSAEVLLPYTAMLALALATTGIVMAPVAQEMWVVWEAVGEGSAWPSWSRHGLVALEPLRTFMSQHAGVEEIEFFAELAHTREGDLRALIPAFLVAEIRAGLGIAVLILIPFVLLDLLVAQILALCGLVLPNLSLVTLPLKVALFLAADGFELVLTNLVDGYSV
ncbi:MAG: hypothetical protein B7733_16860 [Myxococcales bacterium FL481]|nr:MAG: hypothetical protein B7733_16860 [Myxococcales bacterium FL481]